MKTHVYLHVGISEYRGLRQTYFSKGEVGNLIFSETPTEEDTFIVMFGGLPEIIKKFEKNKRICILMENTNIWMPSQEYLGHMGTVVCPFPIAVPTGTRLKLSHAAVGWFYGLKFRTDMGLSHHPIGSNYLELQDLAELPMQKKDKLISCVVSQKIIVPGQLWRVQVALALQKYFGNDIDLWGFGWKPIEDKRQAIDPYRFTVTIENAPSSHYWTEKLADAILGYAIPIYAGATKAGDDFPGSEAIPSIVYGADVDETVGIIKKILDQNFNDGDLWANRHRILYQHNIYYFIKNLIEEIS